MKATLLQVFGLVAFVAGSAVELGVGGAVAASGVALVYLGLAAES